MTAKTLMMRTLQREGERADDKGPTTFIASTPNEARDGDVIEQKWRLDNFKANPVVLVNHNGAALPVGRAENIAINSDGNLQLDVHWDWKDPESARVAGKVKRGFLNSGSVSWSPEAMVRRSTLPKDNPHRSEKGMFHRSPELLEFSIASVPSDVGSVVVRRNLNLDPAKIDELISLLNKRAVHEEDEEEEEEEGRETSGEGFEDDLADEAISQVRQLDEEEAATLADAIKNNEVVTAALKDYVIILLGDSDVRDALEAAMMPDAEADGDGDGDGEEMNEASDDERAFWSAFTPKKHVPPPKLAEGTAAWLRRELAAYKSREEGESEEGDEQRGAGLARLLNDAVDEMESDDMPRADIIRDLGSAAGIDAGTVNQILDAEINCPPLDRLEGFASVLGLSMSRIRAAAESDGCNYDTDDDSGDDE